MTIGAAALTVGFVLDIDYQRDLKGSSVGHDPSQCRPLRRLAGGGKAAGYGRAAASAGMQDSLKSGWRDFDLRGRWRRLEGLGLPLYDR